MMAQQFSNSETTSLEKRIDVRSIRPQTDPNRIEFVYEIDRCVEWIRAHQLHKVCLQFPDALLPDAGEVALRLQSRLRLPVYILGDTAYDSCCIDYVAASHINADGIIHFGPKCFSTTIDDNNVPPHLSINEKAALDLKQLLDQCRLNSDLLLDNTSSDDDKIVILLDNDYIHVLDQVVEVFSQYVSSIHAIDPSNGLNTLIDNISSDKIVLFIGGNTRKLLLIQFAIKPKILYYFHDNKITNYTTNPMILKRRNYLTEKIRDSCTVGIIIGTLGIKNYLVIIDRIKKLLQLNGKKYYQISVGKPTVAKLANFPEIDIYVLVTCSMNEIYENRSDFYQPIVTPYDIELALNVDVSGTNFTYDFNTILRNSNEIDAARVRNRCNNVESSNVSLVSGASNKMRYEGLDDHHMIKDNVDTDNGTQSVAITDGGGTLVSNANYGAGYLRGKTWIGLDQQLGESEVKLAVEGRTGLAQCYGNEMLQQ